MSTFITLRPAAHPGGADIRVSAAITSNVDVAVAELATCDFSFAITEVLAGPFDGDAAAVLATATPVGRTKKEYPFDAAALREYPIREDGVLFVAEVAGKLVGYAAVSRGWNGDAFVDDIAVDANHRRLGVAYRLMDAVAGLAAQAERKGIRIETQNNNVAACRFYASLGFEPGGFDRQLYGAEHPDEVALFWYLRGDINEKS